MLRVTELAQQLVRERLIPGAVAVDATLGNGRDALFLARLVGKGGEVHGFDIQPEAIESTRRTFASAGVSMENVHLHQVGHECMQDHVPPHASRQLLAVMFNLGYLPGGNREVVTRPETTCMALRQAAGMLSSGGILAVAVYPGHEGGAAEGSAAQEFFSSLGKTWSKLEFRNARTLRPVPFLLAATRLAHCE